MKKIRITLIAVAVFACIVLGFSVWVNRNLEKKRDILKDYKCNELLNSSSCIRGLVNADTMVILGSSELDDVAGLGITAFPLTVFNRSNRKPRVVLLGRGFTQSLSHAINVAALADGIKNKKVVLLVSPQWFVKGGITSEAFSSRFQPQMYAECMKNNNISNSIKQRIVERTEQLLEADPLEKKKVNTCNAIYLHNSMDPVQNLGNILSSKFMNLKVNYSILKCINKLKPYEIKNSDKQTDIKFSDLMQEAESNGRIKCSNNKFGVYNDYYTKYMASVMDKKRGSLQSVSYSVSKEYDDLQLFIDVCKDAGVKPLLVSVPVNGRWYDYCGFPQKRRQEYYDKIKEIAQKNQVSLADFSSDEYCLYFLRDIMHLGWKGWVKIDEKIYEFYKQN